MKGRLKGSMQVACRQHIPNGGREPAVLLRKAWKGGRHIGKKAVAKFTHIPPHPVEGFRRVLKGGIVIDKLEGAITPQRSLPHGVVAGPGTCHRP